MQQLKRNLMEGVYRVPRDVEVSLDCLDFLNSCLKFESRKRKSWRQLLEHPFLNLNKRPEKAEMIGGLYK